MTPGSTAEFSGRLCRVETADLPEVSCLGIIRRQAQVCRVASGGVRAVGFQTTARHGVRPLQTGGSRVQGVGVGPATHTRAHLSSLLWIPQKSMALPFSIEYRLGTKSTTKHDTGAAYSVVLYSNSVVVLYSNTATPGVLTHPNNVTPGEHRKGPGGAGAGAAVQPTPCC
jgi:hypothetical protein